MTSQKETASQKNQKAKKVKESKELKENRKVQEIEEEDIDKIYAKHVKDISIKNPHDKFVRHFLSRGDNFRIFLEKNLN